MSLSKLARGLGDHRQIAHTNRIARGQADGQFRPHHKPKRARCRHLQIEVRFAGDLAGVATHRSFPFFRDVGNVDHEIRYACQMGRDVVKQQAADLVRRH